MKIDHLRGFGTILVLAVLLVLTGWQCSGKKSPDPTSAPIYDEKADARKDIAKAVDRAAVEGRQVLIMFGGNWCPWCHRLHTLFTTDEKLREVLQRNYILVLVDVGHKDKNLDLDVLYGHPYKHGFPVLVVLDSDGSLLTVQETGSWEKSEVEGEEKGHDPDKVIAFLTRWSRV